MSLIQLYWYIKALLLIASPYTFNLDIPITPPTGNAFYDYYAIYHPPEEAWVALKHWALVAEVVGPHEKWGTFDSEVKYVNRNWREAKNYPKLITLQRLPTFDTCCNNEALASKYVTAINDKRELSPRYTEELRDTRNVANMRYTFWIKMRQCKSTDNNSWVYRRSLLNNIQEMIGTPAFDEGRWPTPIPMQFMKELP